MDRAEKPMVIGKLLEEKALKNKDKVFLFYGERKITYKDINEIVNKTANGFLKIGIRKGDNVCIMLPNCPEFIFIWFALNKIGAVEVPVNSAYKGEFLRYIIDNCDAKAIVIHGSFVERLKSIQNDLGKLEHIVIINDQGISTKKFSITKYEELLDSAGSEPNIEVDEYDIGAILYTSGTTGNPKGVMLSHGYLYNMAQETARYRELNSEDIVYTCLPLFHANAQVLTTLPCVISDCALALGERFSASTFWSEIRRYRATQFNFIGAMLSYIYKHPASEKDSDHSVKVAYGAPIPKDLYWECRKRFKFRFVEPFGLTESGIICTNLYHEPNPKLGSFGKITRNYEVRIVDNNDYEVPPGTIGEMISRTLQPNHMMSGYYKMPDKTQEAYRNLWFHTGDFGWMDEDGYFYFADRKKDYLRIKGENISSLQVEAVVNSHPKVLESAAIGVAAEGGENELMLYVALKAEEVLLPEELMMWLEEKLPYFAIPRYISYLKQLPKTPTERIEKYKLKELGIGPDVWDRVAQGYKIKR